MSYNYNLSKRSRKILCPSCQKKTFTPYEYADDGKSVHEPLFGKCDRENNCGYHYHPNEEKEFELRPVGEAPEIKLEHISPEPAVVDAILKRTKTAVSPFHIFCKSIGVTIEHVLLMGAYSDAKDKTVFVYRNREGKVVNLKWFQYGEDGKRIKSSGSYYLTNPKPKSPPTPPDSKKSSSAKIVKKHAICLFGEHKLDESKKRIVCVVESEKSAVLASFFYKKFDWVACGAATGLSDGSNETSDKISPLRNRHVYWLADADDSGRDNSSIRNLKKHGLKYDVIDLFPDRTDGYDIGDAIIDGVRPEIKPPSLELKIAKKQSEIMAEWYFGYDLPDDVDKDTIKDDVLYYSHFNHKGGILMVRKMKGKSEDYSMYYTQRISNFTIEALGHIESDLNPRRLITIKNIHGHIKTLEVAAKAFVSLTEFAVFVESVGNFQFDGVGTDLKKIRSKLYDTMPTYEEVETLGWHPKGYMVFANGVFKGKKFYPIDKYGFVNIGKAYFYLPALSCINQTDENKLNYESERKFKYQDRDDITLTDWATLFVNVHKNNGMIAIAWFMAGLFRDHVYNLFKFFPHLFLFGPPGTGKSQVGWGIRALSFIGNKKPFNLSIGTKVAFNREFSHFRDIPAWFDEYDNSIDYERVQNLKAAYDGAGHTKSVKDSDKRVKTTQVESPALISGQQLPIADNALFKRVILCQFHQTEYSKKEQDLFLSLQKMEKSGLTFLTAGMMQFRSLIESDFSDTFSEVLQDMIVTNEANHYEVEDRIMRNMAIICTVYKLIASKLGKKLPFTYENLKPVALQFVNEQMGLIQNSNETNTFWDMVEFLLEKKMIEEGEDFLVEEKKTIKVVVNRKKVVRELEHTKMILFIRFSKIIPLYRENFKKQNNSTAAPMDKGSLLHYIQNSKPYLGNCPDVKFKNRRTSAYALDYEMLRNAGVNLNMGGNEDQINKDEDDKDDLPF